MQSSSSRQRCTPTAAAARVARRTGCGSCRNGRRCSTFSMCILNMVVRPATSLRYWRDVRLDSTSSPCISLTALRCVLFSRSKRVGTALPQISGANSIVERICALYSISSTPAPTTHVIRSKQVIFAAAFRAIVLMCFSCPNVYFISHCFVVDNSQYVDITHIFE